MLVHLRLTTPADLTGEVRSLLVEHDCTTNLVVHEGVGLVPEGDLVECDVAREEANTVLRQLNELGLAERGGIVLLVPDGTPFRDAERIEEAAPGDPDDAIIWDSVLEEAHSGAVPTLSTLVFLTLAVSLAAIAVLEDSSVLVVGAMVVGPEFGAVAATAVGLVFGRWALAGKAVSLLLGAFLLAVLAVAALSVGGRVLGLIDADVLQQPRPQTGFIWQPDVWSFFVALIAGAVGAMALALGRTQAMVGVFIAVTTVPAAGNLALGLALLDAGEIGGSAAQLGLNLVGMVFAGTIVLALQRRYWAHLSGGVERVFGPLR